MKVGDIVRSLRVEMDGASFTEPTPSIGPIVHGIFSSGKCRDLRIEADFLLADAEHLIQVDHLVQEDPDSVNGFTASYRTFLLIHSAGSSQKTNICL